MKRVKGWRLAAMAAALMAAGLHGGAARADQYDDLLSKWNSRAQSAPPLQPNDPDVAMQAVTSSNNVDTYWTALETDPGRTELWPDLPLRSVNNPSGPSSSITSSFGRLGTLLGAYSNASSPHYQDASYLATVLAGFDFLLGTYYGAGVVGYDNWWDWQIGTPQGLNGIMSSTTNQALLTPARVNAMIAAIDYYMPDPTNRANLDGTTGTTTETGANRLDKAFVAVLRGIIGKSPDKISAGSNAVSAVLQNVTSGDGFYADNSFVQHTHFPYVGGYGVPLISDIGKLYYILNNTSWTLANDPNYAAPYNWAMQSFLPYLYNGAMMDNQRGRQITREYNGDHFTGRQVIGALAELATVLPGAQASALQAALAGEVNRDTTFFDPANQYNTQSYFTPVATAVPGVYSGVSTFDIALIKGFLNDPNVTATDEPTLTQVFPSTDRALLRQPGYAFALSTFDNVRMGAFEKGNSENRQGDWLGIGMTWLYNADLTQYGGNYWGTVDMTRLAGTTTDHTMIAAPVDWKFYGNTKNHVGAALLNTTAGKQFAVSSMDFAMTNVTGSPLTGKKAWFLFGDRIVAVGAGISNTNGQDTETIVENRQLDAGGDNTLTVNGSMQSSTPGWSSAMSATSWAHLAGSVAGADIGYVFPDQPVVTGLRETRSGNWANVGSSTSTTNATVSANYLSLALDHGANPSGAAYTYILLPNRTAAATGAFAAANPITVLERSTSATAVSDSSQGLTGIVFWNDASKTVNVAGQAYLTSDKKAVVTIQQNGTDLQLAVADPTQANTGAINLVLNKITSVVVSKDPAITVTQGPSSTTLSVAVNGSAGKSFNAHLSLSSKVSLSPSDDAYARDGTYANTNYGSATSMVVKQDGISYQRKSYLKFDLSSVGGGTIDSAVLTLTPVSVGAVSGMVHNVYQSASDSWTQGALTWNTAPANGSLLNSFSVPAVNQPVQINLTSAANGVLAGDKKLALEIESSAAYGSNGEVDYATKENGNTAYRPTLVITSH